MRKTSLRLSAAVALELAAEQAGIELAEVKNVDLNLISDGFYCVAFHGTWMSYICCIDCVTGEIRGFFSEPLDEVASISTCMESLR